MKLIDHQLFCDLWLSAWTGNEPEKLRQFYCDDAFYRDPSRPNGIRGAELLPYFKSLLFHNPDWQWKALEIIPTQKGFCLKWMATIPLGSATIKEAGLDIVELRDGKISRNEVYFDRTAIFLAAQAKQNLQ